MHTYTHTHAHEHTHTHTHTHTHMHTHTHTYTQELSPLIHSLFWLFIFIRNTSSHPHNHPELRLNSQPPVDQILITSSFCLQHNINLLHNLPGYFQGFHWQHRKLSKHFFQPDLKIKSYRWWYWHSSSEHCVLCFHSNAQTQHLMYIKLYK